MKKSKGAKAEGQKKASPVYWDACIFIHWLKGTGEPGVAEQFRKLHAKELAAVTSALTLVEVLECDIPDERKHLLQILKQMPDRLTIVSVSTKEAEHAHEIRNHYKVLDGRKVQTADAVHLSTAVLNECEALYTFDKKLTRLPTNAAILRGMRVEPPPHPPVSEQAPLPGVPREEGIK
jgi:predicted nucleic acid-binding protein